MEFADAVGVPIPKIEKLPGVRRVGLEINNGERKLQMANTAKQRTAYVSNESFETEGVTGREFILARITENEPGYLVAGHFSTLERAQEVARQRNALNDLNEDAVADIVASSMRAGKV